MYKIFSFENGLKLLYAKNKVNKSTVVEVSFNCGAQADGDLPGLSHFCEHMFFTGTKTENKAEISKQYFDFIKVNAFTNYSEICFTGEIFTHEFGAYLNMVRKMIKESTFSKKAVEDEKKVVCQEIVRDSDNYSGKASRSFSNLLYNKPYYKNGVLGSVETVNKIQSKDVKNYIKTYFVANNCCVYVASPLSFAEVKKHVKTHLVDTLGVNKKLEKFPIDEIGMTNDSKSLIKSAKLDKNYLKIAFKLPHNGYNYRETRVLRTLTNILNDISDGIVKDLRLKNNLVYYADTYFSVNQTDYAFVFSTEVSKENINKCISVFANYISNLLKNGISKTLLEKERREDRYFYESRIMTPTNYIGVLNCDRRYKKLYTPEDCYKINKSISLQEINNILHKIFKSPVFACMVYGDAKKDDVYSQKELQAIFSSL